VGLRRAGNRLVPLEKKKSAVGRSMNLGTLKKPWRGGNQRGTVNGDLTRLRKKEKTKKGEKIPAGKPNLQIICFLGGYRGGHSVKEHEAEAVARRESAFGTGEAVQGEKRDIRSSGNQAQEGFGGSEKERTVPENPRRGWERSSRLLGKGRELLVKDPGKMGRSALRPRNRGMSSRDQRSFPRRRLKIKFSETRVKRLGQPWISPLREDTGVEKSKETTWGHRSPGNRREEGHNIDMFEVAFVTLPLP